MKFDIDYLRSFRIGKFAIFDFVVSYIAVIILGLIFNKLIFFILMMIPLSIIIHIIFKQYTPLTKLFIEKGHCGFKLFVILSVVFAYISLIGDDVSK